MPEKAVQLAEPWDEAQLPLLGNTEPRSAGLLRPIPSSRSALLSALARHCHLGGIGAALAPRPVCLILPTLLLDDCTLKVQVSPDWWQKILTAAGTGLRLPLLLCIELWRGEDGVEVRLGHLVLPQQDSEAGQEEEDVISSTQELAEIFNTVESSMILEGWEESQEVTGTIQKLRRLGEHKKYNIFQTKNANMF